MGSSGSMMGRALRRALLSVAVLSAIAVPLAMAGSASGLVASTVCNGAPGNSNDYWTGTAGDGMWATAGNWSTGAVPTSSTNACLLPLASSYTVDLRNGQSANSVVVGAASSTTTQTLDIQGVPGANSSLTIGANSNIFASGQLILDSQSGGGSADLAGSAAATLTNTGSVVSQVEGSNTDFLEANLDNASGGTVEVKTGELRQDDATTTTNDGSFTTDAAGIFNLTNGSASFANVGGTVANKGAINLSGGASWSQGGGNETNNPVSLDGGTLSDNGTGTSGSFNLFDAVNVSGTIAAGETVTVTGSPGHNSTAQLQSPGVTNNGTFVLDSQSGGGFAEVDGSPLTNNGTFNSQVEGTSLAYLETNLINGTAGTVEVKSGELRQDMATTTTNNKTFKVDAGAQFTMTNGSALFKNQTGGSVTNSGAIKLSGGASWSQGGGNETNNPVSLDGGTLSDNGTGTSGSFNLFDAVNVSGTIAAGETVTVTGSPGHNSTAQLQSPGVTNNGTFVLDSQSGGGYADVDGSPLTNNGTFNSQVEGTSLAYLETNLINGTAGTVEVKSGELRQDEATTTTNNKTFKVDAGAQFTMTNGSALFKNQTGGSVTNSGAIKLSGGASWSQGGGNETNNPVSLDGGTLSDNGTGTSGSFNLFDAVNVSGTIAAGETVTVIGSPGHNSTAQLQSPGVTNNGTFVLDSQSGGGYADVDGSPLTNNGTFNSQVEGTSLAYLETNLSNGTAGTVEVKSGELRQDEATTTTNDGNVILDVGAHGSTSPTARPCSTSTPTGR